jgi:sugar phosphate permease
MAVESAARPVPRRGPLLAQLVPSTTFYGWYIAVACLVIMCVTVGVSYYGLSLFLKPLRDEHGWSNSVVSGATGAFFVISGVAAFVAGPYIDRAGPRRFLAIGITLTALSAGAVGFVNDIWQLYVVYTVLAIAYGLGAVVPVSTLMSRWFIHQRAKAMMISSTGVSLGGAVLVPIGAVLIEHGGLRLAAPILGLVVFVVAMPVLLLVVAPAPGDLGLQPDGGVIPRRAARLDAGAQFRVWDRRTALSTPSFWAATAAFFLALGATTSVLIYQLAFLQEPDKLGSRSAAALAVTTTTIGSILARTVVGLVADRLDKRRMAAVLFVAQAAAITGYLIVHDTVAIYVAALLFGFTVGNVYLVQSLLIGELFGLVSFATVFGMVSLASQIGSGLSLIVVGALVDAHGYTVPFLTLAGIDVVAAAFVLLARPPRARSGAPSVTGERAAAPA